jgi:zinc protease
VTATAFKAHPYRHPTIGWLSDLETMTRDDLLGHYRKYYIPNNATLVIVGDVDADDALSRAERRFGSIPAGVVPDRIRTVEPPQSGARRVHIRKPGTTAYWKASYHAPAVTSPDFFPLLVLDAVLTGANGLNLWSSFRVPPPQRKSRLYRALVERSLASVVSGAVLPTAEPFLFSISATVADGSSLASLEAAALEELDLVRVEGVTPPELARAVAQLKARFVFDGDSVTNVAHQLGYFATVASFDLFSELPARVETVTIEQVAAAAAVVLAESNRTLGWFEPELT